jgi:endonuclease I
MAKCKFMVFGFLFHVACGSDPHTSNIASTSNSPEVNPIVLEYYSNNINELDGEELIQSLYEDIRGHKKISYKSADVALVDIDKSLVGSGEMELFYEGLLVTKSQRSVWNREHLWPQSRGLERAESEAKSDLHHLRPTLKEVNSIVEIKTLISGTSSKRGTR